jgi:uncharacterized membrane protein
MTAGTGGRRAVRGTGAEGQTRPPRPAVVVPPALAGATVLAQVAYPLVGGIARDRLTIATVVLFFAASVSHAWLWRGPRFAAALVAVTAGGGLAVELAGVHLGLPFGAYAYTGRLGPQLAGVPLVIPLAWTMMGYPALVVGRRITAHPLGGPVVAGAALATWDLFLDPQMVDAGLWLWLGGGPTLLDIPLSNFAGWLVTATLMMAALWRIAPAAGDDRVPIALYLWVYASSVLAHLAFLGLPGSALVGGIGMGVIVVALVRALVVPRRAGA